MIILFDGWIHLRSLKEFELVERSRCLLHKAVGTTQAIGRKDNEDGGNYKTGRGERSTLRRLGVNNDHDGGGYGHDHLSSLIVGSPCGCPASDPNFGSSFLKGRPRDGV